MKKFDLIFEKAMDSLRGSRDRTFEDNILGLLSVLDDHDLLSKDMDQYVKDIEQQVENTKEILIGEEDQAVPTIKLLMNQDSGSNTFSVKVIVLDKGAEETKTFENTVYETVFKDVLEHIRQKSFENLDKNAVEELPQEQGANAQPGAEQSALPGVGEEPQQQPPQ